MIPQATGKATMHDSATNLKKPFDNLAVRQLTYALAERSRRGAAVAKLVKDPNRFLAAVQIGVTSTALLSSAFGAVTLSEEAKDFFVDHGF